MSIQVIENQAKRKGSINAQWQRFYTRVFEVVTDDPHTGPLAVMTASGIPQVGTKYKLYRADGTTVSESDDAAFVNSLSPQEVDGSNGTTWEVAVEYGPYDPESNPRDPTATLPKVSFGSQRFDKPLAKDVNGNPIVNSAGDGFSEPVTRDECRSILTVVRNERIKGVPADPLAIPPTAAILPFDLTLAKAMQNKVNDATWNGAAAGTVKCGAITTSEPQQAPDGWWYLAVTYPFEENVDGWDKVLLDQGFAELDDAGNAKQIMGKNGQPINEPVPLDGSGRKLGRDVYYGGGVTPVYLTYRVYERADFSIFNIDLTQILGLV